LLVIRCAVEAGNMLKQARGSVAHAASFSGIGTGLFTPFLFGGYGIKRRFL